jgi:hypothetical protein
MCSMTKITAVAVLLGVALAGCSDLYLDRRDTVSLASGEAMAADRVTHMIDPWPAVSGNRDIASNGQRAAAAAARYRTGHVTPPINATTSSAAYARQAQPVGDGSATAVK